MKNLFLLSISFFLCSAVTNAQSGWAIGDKAGIGHSWTVGNRPDEDIDRKFHPTFFIGRNAVYNFNDNVGLGIGTFFSSEGSTYEDQDADLSLVHRLNYIRIPVIASFSLGDASQKIRPRISVGPSVGFLVGGKSFLLSDDDEFEGSKTVKAMNTKIDAGANASVGFSVKVKEGIWFNHDVNYYHGFVTQTPNAAVAINDAEYTNRNLSLSMGFLINCNAMKSWKGKMHRK